MANKKLKLKPITDPGLLQELAAAQEEADNYNSGQARFQAPKFNLEAELKTMQQNNIIDSNWQQTVIQDVNMQNQNKAQDAFNSAGFSQPIVGMTLQEAKEEEVKKEEKKTLTLEDKLAAVEALLIDTYGRSPTKEQLLNLKRMHGSLFILPIDGENVFVYRYLKKIEYQEILAKQGFANATPLQKAELVTRKCLLFPVFSDEQLLSMPANFVEMLSQQIEIQSMFLDPYQVVQNVIKL